MDQAGVFIHSDVDFHSKVPVVTLLGLVHLWVPFTGFVFGETGSGDQRGINDRALLHGHPPLLEMSLDDIKDFLPQFVLLEQVSEAENRCLIRDLVADQIDSSKSRMLSTSISASSMAGLLRLYHCCIR